jgi:polysaccharide export outer membrane protein
MLVCGALAVSLATAARAQAPAGTGGGKAADLSPKPSVAAPTVPPPDFVIGPGDVLAIVFWREKDLSGDVRVRPDGRISLPLLNDVQAAGLTPEQLREKLIESAGRYLEEPNATVVVKEINSRQVFITGQVGKPGPYPLGAPTTVVQLISMAGGILEYADKENIIIIHAERRPDGEPWSHRINYLEVMKRRNLQQNIELKPGDTVIVP